jgi:uncharacterized protein (DUF952 family)
VVVVIWFTRAREYQIVLVFATVPHLYGPLNMDAVVSETRLDTWELGAFTLPAAPLDID